MKRWYILADKPDVTTVDCYELNHDTVNIHSQLAVEKLITMIKTDPVIIAITSHQWICHRIALPNIKRAFLEKALPSMVEDRVLSPIEDLHVCLPEKYHPGEDCTLWVLSKPCMNAWCMWAQTLGLHIQALIPAYSVLPYIKDHISILQHERHVWIRLNDTEGFCLPVPLVAQLMHRIVHSAPVDLYGDIDDELRQQLSTVHPQMMRVQECILYTSTPVCNFFQGDYQLRHRKRQRGRSLSFIAGCLCSLALLMQISYLAGAHIILSERLAALKSQSLALYQSVYPEAKVVSSPKVTISRALGMGGTGADAFGQMLSSVAQANGVHRMNIKELSFRGDQLRVVGSVPHFEALEGLIQTLQAKGYQVEQQQAQQSEGQLELSFVMKRGSV